MSATNTAMPDDQIQWMNVDEVAKATKLAIPKVVALARRGEFPNSITRRVSGSLNRVWRADEVSAWLAAEAAPPKFCVECTHYVAREPGRTEAMCAATACRKTDLVEGYKTISCRAARAPHSACGLHGLHFQRQTFASYSDSPALISSPATLTASATSSSAGATRDATTPAKKS